MSWRTGLGAVLGLLLPLPLVVLLFTVMRPTPYPAGGPQVIPMLDVEERTSRVTFHRRCASNSDCEPPLGCLSDPRARAQYCTDSQCLMDSQCPQGQVCRGLPTNGDGPLVRRCVPIGIRQEGEACVTLAEDQSGLCGSGLECRGRRGWCARTCQLGEAMGCPEDFFCADVYPQPACLPTCEARGCPEGQQCIRFEEGASICAVVYGPSCQQTSCPQGQTCEVQRSSSHPGKLWTDCLERCGEGHPPCAEGRVCAGWRCGLPCDPEAPRSCPEGYRCEKPWSDSPWVCRPDNWRAGP